MGQQTHPGADSPASAPGPPGPQQISLMQVWRDSPTGRPPALVPAAVRPTVLMAAPSPAHTGKLPSRPKSLPCSCHYFGPGPP